MNDFRELNPDELKRLGDEELVEYALKARAQGYAEAERLALDMLAFGLEPFVTAVVARKIPLEDVTEVAAEVLEGALKSLRSPKAGFRGTTLAEFRGWLARIAAFKIADYHRTDRVETEPLASEHEGDEGVFGGQPSTLGEVDAVEAADVVESELAALDPPKRMVAELKIFEDRPTAEVVERVNEAFPELNSPMTAANADQIASRFRKDLRGKLD